MSLWMWIALAVGVLVLVIVALVAWAIIDGMKQDQRYLEQGTRVLGWIVQANPVLYSGGGMDNAALVLISFDAKADPPDPFMYQLANEIAQIKNGTPPTSPAEAEVSVTLSDDTYRPFQRIRIPDELTGGREVYAMHVWVSRALLPGTTLQYVYIRCLVIRDDPKSRAMMIKYEPHDEAFRGARAKFAGV
jgi:hypothetical protein